MEEKRLTSLKKELKLKKFQFNSIYEFSSTLYSSFEIDDIIRIFFSTLMGQMGISRVFFLHTEHHLLKKRGFQLSESETDTFNRVIEKTSGDRFYIKANDLAPPFTPLKELLLSKKIHYLVNMSESKKKIVLGLGLKFNRDQLSEEDIEFSFFISRFALIAIDNAFLIKRIIENKRIEHEMKIAKDIQQSLLPQHIPQLKNFDIGVVYQPINEVGGDYYDILRQRNGQIPILIADVEGKGLSAALLAASSQAVIHSLNELYFFEPAKFISKANSLIYDFTRGGRFITLFWMLLDDDKKAVTYVNAGHVAPLYISKNKVCTLSRGGFLTGFVESAQYQKETIEMRGGDVIVAYTDGVSEVENPAGEEFGEEAVIEFVKQNRSLPAQELSTGLYREILDFSRGKKFRDDFTLIIIKVK